MKIITFLCLLLAWPMMVSAQKISAFTEMLELSDPNLLLIATDEGANYKTTYGTLVTNLGTRIRALNGNITFTASNTYNIGSATKPAAYIFATRARILQTLEVRTTDLEGAWIGSQNLILGTNLTGVAHGISFRRSADGAIVSGVFNFNDGTTPNLALLSIGDIAFMNYPGERSMTIKPDGKVGIGTETPTTSLDVTGGVRAATMTIVGTTNQLIFGATNIAPASAVAPVAWVSVQVTGNAGVWRVPLYQ
jgi:hypothetical protein